MNIFNKHKELSIWGGGVYSPLTKKGVCAVKVKSTTNRRFIKLLLGRSLIELLTVLAIIGILSIAALMGFRQAMNRHAANVILNDVHLLHIAVGTVEKRMEAVGDVISAVDFLPETTYPIDAFRATENSISVVVDAVPKEVCVEVLNRVDSTETVAVTDETGVQRLYIEDKNICGKLNLIAFFIGADFTNASDICIPECGVGDVCINHACCPKDRACSSSCCAENEHCSMGHCCPSELDWINGKCQCSADRTWDVVTQTCKCPTAKPYFFGAEAGGPLCCTAGQRPLDGVCSRFTCTSSVDGNCSINGLLCGYKCNQESNGTMKCGIGICDASKCPNGPQNFTKLPGVKGGGYWYGCSIPNSNCYYFLQGFESSSIILCYDGEKPCCRADNQLNCYEGTCDASVCTALGAKYEMDVVSKNNFWCVFPNGVKCNPNVYANGKPSQWECYNPSDAVCSTNCKNPPYCGYTETGADKDICSDKCNGFGVQDENGYCCDETGYCLEGTDGYLRLGNAGAYTYSRCGRGCSIKGACTAGNCKDPGCAAVGAVYSAVIQEGYNFWGCSSVRDGELMQCSYNSSYSPAICRYNDATCGKYCNYDGTNCKETVLPACTASGYCLISPGGASMGSDLGNPTCKCATLSNGVEVEGSISYYDTDGNYYCCPKGQTYINGGCGF